MSTGLTVAQTCAFLRDPDNFLQRPHGWPDTGDLSECEWADLTYEISPWYEDPTLMYQLEQEWSKIALRCFPPVRKSWAIQKTFAGHPAAGQFTAPDRWWARDGSDVRGP